MLKDVINYSGLYAKIKALESRLLSYDDYYTLASQKDVVSLASRLFENETYKEYASDMQEAIVGGRFPLEKSLVQSMYSNFSGIYNFITDSNVRQYINVLFLKYEAGILKALLRTLFDKRDIKDVAPKYENFISKRLKVDMQKLAESKDLKDFMNNLVNSKFLKVLNKINVDNPSLFDFETQLDIYCYLETWNCQNKLLKHKRSQERINGSDIDLHNIMHIYRFKKYYDLSDSIIYAYLIPINYRVNKSQIDSLIASKTDSEFLEIISKTHYKDVFKNCCITDMERSYYSYMLKIYNEEAAKNPYSVSIVTAYFFKKGQEIRNLITLTECVRYGLKHDESMAKLNIAAGKGSEING